VVAHLVAARTREIGIRMTLGASRRDVVAVVMSASLKLAIAGVAIGLTGAFATSRLLSGMLFGITARDPWTFTAVPLAMLAVAAAASYLPARRALRVDPVVALRQDA
jgi:putative ABC transport system permease protein